MEDEEGATTNDDGLKSPQFNMENVLVHVNAHCPLPFLTYSMGLSFGKMTIGIAIWASAPLDGSCPARIIVHEVIPRALAPAKTDFQCSGGAFM
jgi:hypothetical protein